MKATTLPPEHAALIAAKVQTIITFARKPKVTAGDRLAIHAGTRRPRDVWTRTEHDPQFPPTLAPFYDDDRFLQYDESSDGDWGRYRWTGPLGAIVASAVVRDVVPIRGDDDYDDIHHLCIDNSPGNQGGLCRVWKHGYENISDQLPYADFTPGRWAVLLDDVALTTDRCPACWNTWSPCRVSFTQNGYLGGAGTCPPIPWRGGPGVWRWEP